MRGGKAGSFQSTGWVADREHEADGADPKWEIRCQQQIAECRVGHCGAHSEGRKGDSADSWASGPAEGNDRGKAGAGNRVRGAEEELHPRTGGFGYGEEEKREHRNRVDKRDEWKQSAARRDQWHLQEIGEHEWRECAVH